MRAPASWKQGEFTEGQSFANFEIVALIGTGAMAEVYRARDRNAANREVALKILSRDARLGEFADVVRELFLGEAKALANVSSPHVVHIVSAGAAELANERIPYLAMEYLRGRDLAGHLELKGRDTKSRLPTAEAVDIVTAICEGVLACHKMNVIHRDIKPANIYLHETPTGLKPVLLDLSVAKLIRPEDAERSLTHIRVGTPNYMAPEQDAQKPATVRSDQYSLSAVLFRCLTGASPRKHDDPRAFLAAVAPQLDARLVSVMMRALSITPEDRFPSVFEFGAALQPFASQLTQDVWRPFYGRPRADLQLVRHSAVTVIGPTSGHDRSESTVSSLVAPTTVDVEPPALMTNQYPALIRGRALPRLHQEPLANPQQQFHEEPQMLKRKRRWPLAVALSGTVALAALGGQWIRIHHAPRQLHPETTFWASPPPARVQPEPNQARATATASAAPKSSTEPPKRTILVATPIEPTGVSKPAHEASPRRAQRFKHHSKPAPAQAVDIATPLPTKSELEKAPDGSPILPLDFGIDQGQQ